MVIRELLKRCYYGCLHIARFPSRRFSHTHYDATNNIAGGVSLKRCRLGSSNYVAKRCSFYNVVVGSYCCFGPDVHIGGMQHSYWWYSQSPLLSDYCHQPAQTTIGNDVWIGAACVIKQGITIGDGAVIGANSFVNKDVEPFSIVAGSPARHIKYRFDQDVRKRLMETQYWNQDISHAKSLLEDLPPIEDKS